MSCIIRPFWQVHLYPPIPSDPTAKYSPSLDLDRIIVDLARYRNFKIEYSGQSSSVLLMFHFHCIDKLG